MSQLHQTKGIILKNQCIILHSILHIPMGFYRFSQIIQNQFGVTNAVIEWWFKAARHFEKQNEKNVDFGQLERMG